MGITGGVTSMPNFLARFFPHVAAQSAAHASNASSNAYCTYTDANLQLFTSSLFLAAAFAGLAGSFSTRCSPGAFLWPPSTGAGGRQGCSCVEPCMWMLCANGGG